MDRCELTLLATQSVAEGTTAFRFTRPDGFHFLAGQYVDLTHLAAVDDPAGNLRSFSIASAPHETDLLVVTRMRGSPFKQALAALSAGSAIEAVGPHGELVLDNDARPVVMIAGGIGITPFRAMLRDLAFRRDGREVTLLYGNRTPHASAFLHELDAMAAQLPRLRVVHCMSEASAGWEGDTGFMDERFVSRNVPDIAAPVYYVVGPPAMTESVREALTNLGVDDDAVRVEAFAGY
jgi:ferredoxin-NADP reductase